MRCGAVRCWQLAELRRGRRPDSRIPRNVSASLCLAPNRTGAHKGTLPSDMAELRPAVSAPRGLRTLWTLPLDPPLSVSLDRHCTSPRPPNASTRCATTHAPFLLGRHGLGTALVRPAGTGFFTAFYLQLLFSVLDSVLGARNPAFWTAVFAEQEPALRCYATAPELPPVQGRFRRGSPVSGRPAPDAACSCGRKSRTRPLSSLICSRICCTLDSAGRPARRLARAPSARSLAQRGLPVSIRSTGCCRSLPHGPTTCLCCVIQ